MVNLEQAIFGYIPNRVLLKNIYLTIYLKSCAGLIVQNRCGKSTLIKLVVGALNPLNVKSTVDPQGGNEYIAQHQLEQLNAEITHLKTMVCCYPGDRSNTHIEMSGTLVMENCIKTQNHIELSQKNIS